MPYHGVILSLKSPETDVRKKHYYIYLQKIIKQNVSQRKFKNITDQEINKTIQPKHPFQISQLSDSIPNSIQVD